MLSPSQSQRGIALVVGLVMLTVLTLLVVTAVKIGVLELKIGGVSYGAAQNSANIDLALAQFINDNAQRFSTGCLTRARSDPASCFYRLLDFEPARAYLAATGYVAPYALYGGTVEIQAQEVSCVGNSRRGSGTNVTDTAGHASTDLFTADIIARARGNVSGETIVRTGAAFEVVSCSPSP